LIATEGGVRVRKAMLLVLVLFLGVTLIFASEIVLRVWDRLPQMGTVVDLFNSKMESEGKNVRAVFELIPYEQQVSKFIAALSAGKGPDIYSLDLIQFPYFISAGAFVDITEHFNALPFKDELPEGILALGKYDGGIYALPYELDLSVLFWNKDLFREAGLDPDTAPATWEELVEFAQKLTVDDNGDGTVDQWGFCEVGSAAGEYMFCFLPFVWNNGGRMFDSTGKVVFNSQETVEALQFWRDLISIYKVAPPSSPQWALGDVYHAFVAGRIAMFPSGNFHVTPLRQDAPDLDFGVALLPKGKGEYATFGGGNMIGIVSLTQYPEEAWSFVEFAMSEEALVEAFAPHMLLVPRPSLYDNQYYATVPQMMDFASFIEYAVTPYTMKYNEVYDPVLYYIQGALLGHIDVAEAVRKCDEEIKELVE